MLQVVESLNQIVQALDDLTSIKDAHSSAMQEVEYRISDILHLIEFNKIPDSCCRKVIDELHKLRQLRRDLKNQYEILKTYETHKEKLIKDNSRFMFSSEIGKTVKRLDSVYNNRVYTDEELKEFLTPMRGRKKKEDICSSENARVQETDNDSQWNTTESNASNES